MATQMTTQTTLKPKFTNDILFKMLFVRYPELLKKLTAALLDINPKDITNFKIKNPEMPPENLGDKFCRLDISMMVNNQHVNLEIQNHNEGDFPERSLFHWAKLYSSALQSGKEFSELPKTIVISILNFKLFDCKEYHSEFQALEINRRAPLTDRMSLRYFELPKLPNTKARNNLPELWLALFKAETEEELKEIEELEVDDMNQAINAYYEITAESEMRERVRLWEKARHDEASAMANARRQGETARAIAIAKNLLRINLPIDQIATSTNLTPAEIESLRQAD